jgi:hypothetical protein
MTNHLPQLANKQKKEMINNKETPKPKDMLKNVVLENLVLF